MMSTYQDIEDERDVGDVIGCWRCVEMFSEGLCCKCTKMLDINKDKMLRCNEMLKTH